MPQNLYKPYDQQSIQAEVQSAALHGASQTQVGHRRNNTRFSTFSKGEPCTFYVGKEHTVEATTAAYVSYDRLVQKSHLQPFLGMVSY